MNPKFKRNRRSISVVAIRENFKKIVGVNFDKKKIMKSKKALKISLLYSSADRLQPKIYPQESYYLLP